MTRRRGAFALAYIALLLIFSLLLPSCRAGVAPSDRRLANDANDTNSPVSPASHPDAAFGNRDDLPSSIPDGTVQSRYHLHKHFLLTAEDYERDPDVAHLMSQMHEPAAIARFYRTAAQVYRDLPLFHRELQENAETAERFLKQLMILATGAVYSPLTVTQILFAGTKRLMPLFRVKSEPLERLCTIAHELEREDNQNMVQLLTTFFESFTLREVASIDQFIELMSQARVVRSTVRAKRGKRSRRSNSGSVRDRESRRANGHDTPPSPTRCLDLSRTALLTCPERVRVTLANVIAKMDLLLNMFVSDESVAFHSQRLIRRLWNLHVHRLQARMQLSTEEIQRDWMNINDYYKTPINFGFADWSPNMPPPVTTPHVNSAAIISRNASLSQQGISFCQSNARWIVLIVLVCTAIVALGRCFLTLRQRRMRQAVQSPVTKHALR